MSWILVLLGCDGSPEGVGKDPRERSDTGEPTETGTPPDTSTDTAADTSDTEDPADSGSGGGGGDTGGGGGTTDPCATLTPRATATENRAAIEACLGTVGYATLGAGVFEIDSLLRVPTGATLAGTSRSATLRATGRFGNGLLYMGANSTVRGLTLDANQVLDDTNGAVVHVLGSNVTVDDCWIGNVNGHVTGLNLAGVYFMDDTSNGSVVRDSEITNLFYGVIFRAGLDASEVNRVEGSVIHDTACDGVTFAGYGELLGSTLYHHGWDCENGPIPGASVYGLNNLAGARIDGNEFYDDCGNVIDLDTVWSFEITDNVIRDAGYTWGGTQPHCGGTPLMMIDAAFSTVRGNVISSNDRPNNRVGELDGPREVYRRSSRDPHFDDLSPGSATSFAFQLLQRPSAPGATVLNVIEDNELRAACSSGCVGVGYFASRGTGMDASEAASEATMNRFSRNNPFGSDIGSVRCGLNAYAWSDTCDGTFPHGDCNGDDHQHTAFLRNDGCETY